MRRALVAPKGIIMQTFLDNAPIESDATTLAAALAAASAAAGDRLLVQATADGTPVPDEHFGDPPATDPYCGELCFTSADRVSVVRVTLHEAADSLDASAPTHREIAELLQTGDHQAAIPRLSAVLQTWQRVEETVRACAGVEGIDIVGGPTNADLDGAISKLSDALSEVKDAITSADFVTVADVTGDDLYEHTETWASMLRSLADHVQAAPAADA